MELFNLLAKLTLDTNEFDKDLDQAEKDLNAIEVDDPQLGLDNDDFNSGIEESQGLGETFGSDMEKVFKGIKTALTVTGIVGAITGIVNGLKEAINMTAQTADGIDKGSKRLGISRQAYQEWDHALKQSGSSIDDVKKGLMNMQLAMKAADPMTMFDPDKADDAIDRLADQSVGLSEDVYNAMRDLGLLDDLVDQKFENTEQLMGETLKRLAAYKGEDRGLLVRAIFGKGGDNLNALLDEGVDGVEDLLNEASKLGLIMSDEEIDNAVKYGDAVANLNAELDAIKQAFVADIIPVLTDAVSWLTDFLAKLNPRLNTNSIDQIFDDIDQKTLKATTDIDEATVTAKKLIEDLQSMGDYWTLDDEGKMTWDALAAKALELFPQLSDYIDSDGKKIQGNTQDIEDNIEAWARLEKQRLLATAMEEKQAEVAKQLTAAYEKGAKAREQEAVAEGKRATAIEEVNTVLGKNEELKNAVYGAFGVEKVDETNADQILNWIHDNGFETVGMDTLDEWLKLEGQAKALREEAEKMKEKANEANDSLKDEAKYLGEEMGLTSSEIEKATSQVGKLSEALKTLPKDVYINFHTQDFTDGTKPGKKAIGDAYVPYDNYPALLHRGEKVLTATEARRGEGNTDFSGLEDKIIAAIREGMDGATVNTYLNGQAITDEVNRNNMRGVKGRRFAK